jgi:branched-chain amino acid transport system permease protein
MEAFLAYSIVGLTTAAIYAIIGSGLVLTYTTTGVFNFAHGAAGMLAAFTYWQLTASPANGGLGWPVPVGLAVVLLVAAPLFGLGVERVIIRPVSALGDTEKLVVTVAMLSGLIAVAQWIWNPNISRSLPRFFPNASTISLGSTNITWHELITMIVAIAVAVALRFLLHGTRIGTQMRATVDDRALAGLTGADPDRSNKFAWVFSTQLAAIGGILIAPELPLDATSLSLLIVSAYTAAVFGRLRSLPMTFLGAVVLGLAQAYVTGYAPQSQDLQGLQVATPALLLFLALLVFPHGRLRGRSIKTHPVPVPTIRGTALFALATVAFGVILATTLSQSDLVSFGPIFSFGLIALSFVPLAGYAGQVSLAQLSLAGIGALTWVHLAPQGQWWALLAVIAVSAVAGAVIAIPALRLTGIYLVLGTAAFAVIMDDWVFTIPHITIGSWRIGLFESGDLTAVGPRIFGHGIDSEKSLMIMAAIFLALASVVVALIRRGRLGRRLIAQRDSEAAYAMLGGNLLVSKVIVFAISAGIAGLGGAVYAMQQQSITSVQFSFQAGLPIFLIAIVAGASFVGAGLFAGTSLVGPINAMIAVASSLTNFTSLLPALAGIGLGRSPAGIIAMFRKDWAPLGRRLLLLGGLLAAIAALWVLRLKGDVNGWELFWGSAVLALAAQNFAKARAQDGSGGSAETQAGAPGVPGGAPRDSTAVEAQVPVEWLGLQRPWHSEDEEVLDRAIARG